MTCHGQESRTTLIRLNLFMLLLVSQATGVLFSCPSHTVESLGLEPAHTTDEDVVGLLRRRPLGMQLAGLPLSRPV